LFIRFVAMISTEDLYRIFLQHPAICTDSRKLRTGDLFFALKGENFNGNLFAVQALENGAAYAIIDEVPVHTETSSNKNPATITGNRMIRVEDVLTSLQALAAHHRNQFSIPVIAITGSNGKTTTKELVHAVLSEKYKTYTTEGNLNNHIGIPLTLLKIKKDAEIALVEMGANHLQEIAGYCVYTRPTHGLITNCGKAHLEGFGSIEGVRKGKGELYDYLRDHGGSVFVMWDYDYLREMCRGIKEIVTYGTSQADITGVEESAIPHLRVRMTAGVHLDTIQTRLTGNYNLPNVLAAVCLGNYFNVEPSAIKKGIEKYIPSNSRSQLIHAGTNTIVLDAYNANPSSMKLAIENFILFPASEKVLLLGAMAELGSGSIAEHEQILHLVGTRTWKEVLLVGGDFQKIKNPYRVFPNAKDAGKWLESRSFQNTAFLVKGSRSMQMEKAIQSLTQNS
jgi:UDP-N-acetylmuramoyl-tripeptide--D-alanyl-D-alanine ligase